ncbi:MAG: tol-pal system YbgF family protein [Oligoflexales bacterium]
MRFITRYFLFFLIVGGLDVEGQAARRQVRQVEVEDRDFRKRKQKTIEKSSKGRINRKRLSGFTLEAKLVKGIERTIRYLDRTAIRLPKKSKSRFRTYEKIINLYMEQAVFVAREEERSYDRSWERWDRNKRKGKEPKINSKRSKKFWLNIVNRSRSLIREYPKVEEVPELMFQQGLALEFAGRTEQSVRVLKKLVNKYPESPVVGEAYYSLGDYDFERSRFTKARTYYQKALKYKRSRRYGWARFKIGWCYFNDGEFKKALKSWKTTVSYSRKIGGETGRQLREETLRDMVYAFAELRAVDPAVRYFRRNSGGKYVVDFLSLLGDTYYSQGQFARSVKVWRRLQVLAPNHRKAADAQKEIISLLYLLKKYKSLQSEIKRYYVRYGPKSRWASRNTASRSEVLKDIDEQSIFYAKRLHKDGQVRRGGKPYVYAKKLYLQYMKIFPRSPLLMEVRENLADIEYFSNRFTAAGHLYKKIVLSGTKKAWIPGLGKQKIPIHRRSADHMLDSYNRAFVGELQNLNKKKPNFKVKPKPLSKNAQNFIGSCKIYKNYYPKVGKQNKTCHLFVTEVYYRSGYRQQATAGMWDIIKRYPREKVAESSVGRLLQMNQVNSKDLIATIQKVLQIPNYSRGKTKIKLEKLLRATVLDDIAKDKNPLSRARRYEAVAKKQPKASDASSIWMSSADSYLQAGDVGSALSSYGVVASRYSRSKEFEQATLQLAKIEDRRLNWLKSAKYYQAYAVRFSSKPDALSAQRRACVLLISSSVERAAKDCSMYLRKKPEDARDIWPLLVEVVWRSKKYQVLKQVAHPSILNSFSLAASQKIVALHRWQSVLPKKSAQYKQLQQMIFQMAQGQELEGEALRIVSGLLFAQTGRAVAALQTSKLAGGSVANLQRSLEQVSSYIQAMEQDYGTVLSVGDPYWGIAALYQKGQGYEAFANIAANPPQLNDVKAEELKTQLAPLVADMRNKANEQYSLAFELSNRFKVHNDWVIRLYLTKTRLAGKTQSFDEWVVLPDFVGAQVHRDIFKASR